MVPRPSPCRPQSNCAVLHPSCAAPNRQLLAGAARVPSAPQTVSFCESVMRYMVRRPVGTIAFDRRGHTGVQFEKLPLPPQRCSSRALWRLRLVRRGLDARSLPPALHRAKLARVSKQHQSRLQNDYARKGRRGPPPANRSWQVRAWPASCFLSLAHLFQSLPEVILDGRVAEPLVRMCLDKSRGMLRGPALAVII